MAKTQHGRDLSGEEMAQMLDEFANGAREADLHAFAVQITKHTHRTIQQKVMALVVRTLEEWTDDLRANRFDARNEATVKLAAKMIGATGDRFDRYLPTI